MNDEQFENAIGHFIPEIQEQIRARDTARRDAAQVETNGLRRERDIAQAQLAEAVGLLGEVMQKDGEGWGTLDGRIEAFLARHAHAEQQEAREPVLARPDHGVTLDEALALTIDRYSDAIVKLAASEQQEAQGAQAGEFEREDRYLVVKRKDLELLSPTDRDLALTLMGELSAIMETWNVSKRQYVVVEGDWPEYEPTWAAIQARVEGQAGEFWTWLDLAYRDGSKGEGRNFTKHNMEVAYRAGAEAAQAKQGAQVGDERAVFCDAVRETAKEFCDTVDEDGLKRDAFGEFVHSEPKQLLRICQLYRAALATQPAAGEPLVYISAATMAKLKSGIVVPAALFTPPIPEEHHGVPLYAAPPAAAHGDEAVQLLRKLDEQWNAHDGEKQFGKLMRSVESFLAMRAQGDGGQA